MALVEGEQGLTVRSFGSSSDPQLLRHADWSLSLDASVAFLSFSSLANFAWDLLVRFHCYLVYITYLLVSLLFLTDAYLCIFRLKVIFTHRNFLFLFLPFLLKWSGDEQFYLSCNLRLFINNFAHNLVTCDSRSQEEGVSILYWGWILLGATMDGQLMGRGFKAPKPIYCF